MKSPKKLARMGAVLLVLTLGAAPLLTMAADHLDAPALGGTVVAGEFAPHSEHGDRDINDLYVFQGQDKTHTVFALTTNPAINLFGGNFGKNVRYQVNIDTNGDAVQDIAYVATFGGADSRGSQHFNVARYVGANAVSLADGTPVGSGFSNGKGKTILHNGEWVWAGVRSDPFFFDLLGFLGTVRGVGSNCLAGAPGCLNPGGDFFARLNTNAIVLEVPDSLLAKNIGVWGRTSYTLDGGLTWTKADQMGRPAINTVFNASPGDKNGFNTTEPADQRSTGNFKTNITNWLTGFGYSVATADFIANYLLPDVITYDTTTDADGAAFPFNGRALSADVIDAELGVVTNGAITTDAVGPHSDYLDPAVFPYLGDPHP